jgi:2,3-bisphosphoglycerate-independent phosphoglycerate mutase
MNSEKVFLMILDGWGIGKKDFTDGIYNARTPFINQLYQTVPNTTLTTFGNEVGLPNRQMGNSEVGHMNIGAGRVVWQQLALINKKFEDGSAANEEEIVKLANYCIDNQKPLHLIGLVSDGGVHSSIEHLIQLCHIFTQKELAHIYIHAFTDGRDTDPQSALQYLSYLESAIENTNARVVSIIGRYFAMDRDKRWAKTKKAYKLMVDGLGEAFNTTSEAINASYKNGITDEFIEPCTVNGTEATKIKDGDAVFCFNFRTDRGRQITQVLTQQSNHEFGMHVKQLYFATMTEYDKTYQNIHVVFKSSDISETLGEVISKHGKTQLRSAETEKYPHVTFFFSGGREELFEGEGRLMEPSPQVSTYDLQPEMSALTLTDKILNALETQSYDFICLNFANTDMVGHTGVWDAIIKAAETVDSCAQKIVEKGLSKGYQFIIISDHGNSDEAKNPDGSPNTAHSMNPVPCFILSDKCKAITGKGKLADVAPTILKMMGLEKPKAMDGVALF